MRKKWILLIAFVMLFLAVPSSSYSQRIKGSGKNVSPKKMERQKRKADRKKAKELKKSEKKARKRHLKLQSKKVRRRMKRNRRRDNKKNKVK